MPRALNSIKKAERTDPIETVFRTFLATSGLLRTKMREYLDRHGISGSQWGVLRILRKAEQEGQIGVRLSDISQRLLITPPSVTGVVNRLERLGWVVRSTSDSDQRSKLVKLTNPGRKVIAQVVEGHRQRVYAVMAGLSADELQELQQLLLQLGRHLEKIPAP